MELKHHTRIIFCVTEAKLLIVPYGIETLHIRYKVALAHVLLIVPYGIETEQVGVQNVCTGLLIVPYGIETPSNTQKVMAVSGLLIVPYGIETEKVNEYTLSVNVLLIVPYGIETCGIEI